MAISSLSLVMVKPAYAQAPPTPIFSISIPTATYQVPTSYSTDPYTGATITNQGYTVYKLNITFTIQNNPNISYYLLQYKGHFSSEWSNIYEDGFNITGVASQGPQTIFTIFGTNSSGPLGQTPINEITLSFPTLWERNFAFGSKLDFRLQAINGTIKISPLYGANHQMGVGEASEWSNIQTVSIPDGSVTSSDSSNPTVTPSPTPTIPELSWLVIVPLLLSLLSVTVLFRHRKTDKMGVPQL